MDEVKKPKQYWFETIKLKQLTDKELFELDKYLEDLIKRAKKVHYKVWQKM